MTGATSATTLTAMQGGAPQGSALQTAGAVASGANAIGQIVSGYGSYQNNQQKADADTYNANLAGSNATLVAQESANDVGQTRIKQQLQEGEERAATGESGTGGAGTGTNLAVMQQSEMFNKMSALNQQYQGTVKRYSLLDQQTLDNYSADVAKHNSTNDLINTGFSTTNALLKGYNSYTNSSGF